MGQVLNDLVSLLALERIEENLYRGQSQDLGWGTVFGGQVLGQAVAAASRTVEVDRLVHSLHAYFLRPGDVSKPIVYHVDRIRTGGSFTTRRVVAIQGGEPIFNLAASFQRQEEGFEHAADMPTVPPPEAVPTEAERAISFGEALPPGALKYAKEERPFELRSVEAVNPFSSDVHPPVRHVWFKTTGTIPDDPALHRSLLAYVSDHHFITTALLPHGVSFVGRSVQIASLDHCVWFHRPFRVDEWLLHAMESPTAQGARGFVRGRVYSRGGTLVATTAQEGLLRKRTQRA